MKLPEDIRQMIVAQLAKALASAWRKQQAAADTPKAGAA